MAAISTSVDEIRRPENTLQWVFFRNSSCLTVNISKMRNLTLYRFGMLKAPHLMPSWLVVPSQKTPAFKRYGPRRDPFFSFWYPSAESKCGEVGGARDSKFEIYPSRGSGLNPQGSKLALPSRAVILHRYTIQPNLAHFWSAISLRFRQMGTWNLLCEWVCPRFIYPTSFISLTLKLNF